MDHSTTDPFAQAKQALELDGPVGWRWPDKHGNAHDGPELIGRYLADDYSDRHEVDIRLIQTADGRVRSLFMWKEDEEREFHLVPRWNAAAPKHGDMVAIRQTKKPSAKNPGQTYNDYRVVVIRADEVGTDEPDEAAIDGREVSRSEFGY
jgi:hypothetical protein